MPCSSLSSALLFHPLYILHSAPRGKPGQAKDYKDLPFTRPQNHSGATKLAKCILDVTDVKPFLSKGNEISLRKKEKDRVVTSGSPGDNDNNDVPWLVGEKSADITPEFLARSFPGEVLPSLKSY
jgi:hypothetical protein